METKKILMTHLYYGDPNEEFSLNLAETLINAGVDTLEIGIPYTDPVCDGKVFQRACGRALGRGITPFKVLEGIGKLRKSAVNPPIYLTSYYAPIFKIGVKRFIGLAKESGVTGLIVPDILLEEQEELQKCCREFNLSIIQFATVYSSITRLKQLCEKTDDFIYCISLPGVTGEIIFPLNYSYSHTEVDIGRLIKNLKKITGKKILVGFGIKSKEDASKIIKMGADGVIVGSSITEIYEKNADHPETTLSEIATFVKRLKESTI